MCILQGKICGVAKWLVLLNEEFGDAALETPTECDTVGGGGQDVVCCGCFAQSKGYFILK